MAQRDPEGVRVSAEKERLVKVILVVRDGLAQAVDGLNEVLREIEPTAFREAGTEQPDVTEDIPRIDLADLEAAGWTSYATKNPAKEGEAGWIKNPAHFTSFEPPQVIFELVKALTKAKGNRLTLGAMTYFFSGEKKFVSRQPAKREKAR